MIRLSLAGKWKLSCPQEGITCPATVPGCNFIDLENNGIIPDPFIACNEKQVQWVGEKDWVYEKSFELDDTFIQKQYQFIVFDMLDTLAEVYLNSRLLGKTYNAYRQYEFDIKGIATEGKNDIKIVFRSPLPYIRQKHKKMPLPNLTEGEVGSCHIRKPAYHFGWDWAPHLLSCGMTKDVYLQGYDNCMLKSVAVNQKHENGKVTLTLSPVLSHNIDIKIDYTLTSPCGKSQKFSGTQNDVTITVDNPKLWWCNGLGKQPLYSLVANLQDGNTVTMQIGLRTITLDKSEDKYGQNFCFVINGKKIFARGANWVPSDSFICRTQEKDIQRLILSAKQANFNMLRVWGGGYYESDEFYSLCDRYGILVWQDCMFACSPYPYNDNTFIDEVLNETRYNVTRLRHHASLALWCGNNEVEAMSAAWIYRPDVIKRAKKFFYETLPQTISTCDNATPYHPGSPCGNAYMTHFNSDNYGDTHLWKVWHGMRAPEYLKKRKTRFCSEYGLQSFPHVNTLKRINYGKLPPSIDCDVMKVHQKAVLGNSRSLYYVADRFFTPSELWDLSYLTQLNQAYCAELATDFWRINKDRCNGSLYWQYNDCWGVTSWAGTDYYGNHKAILYRARRFNAPVCVSLLQSRKKIAVYALNDTLTEGQYDIVYGLQTTDGVTVSESKRSLTLAPQSVKIAGELSFCDIKNARKENLIAYARLYDKNGTLISNRCCTLVKENKASLKDPHLDYVTSLEGNEYKINITSKAFARGVELVLDGIDCIFSDNYFDITANSTACITVDACGKSKEQLDNLLRIRSLYDIKPKHGKAKDTLMRLRVFLHPFNFVNWLYRSFE